MAHTHGSVNILFMYINGLGIPHTVHYTGHNGPDPALAAAATVLVNSSSTDQEVLTMSADPTTPSESSPSLPRGYKTVTEFAADVLGGHHNADQWLKSPNQALGKARPMDLLATQAGTRQVLGVLTAIQYGGAV
jgi:putative toxin-antitoxin system antitoxin component (TIGR02293 family)